MFYRYFHYLLVAIAAIALNARSINVMPMPCCNATMHMQEMPCHSNKANHSEQAKQCSMAALCAKCLHATPGLHSQFFSTFIAHKNQLFIGYNNIAVSSISATPERPPKVAG